MIFSPFGPTGSICFRPPYRLPVPAANTSKTGFATDSPLISGPACLRKLPFQSTNLWLGRHVNNDAKPGRGETDELCSVWLNRIRLATDAERKGLLKILSEPSARMPRCFSLPKQCGPARACEPRF